MIGQMRITVIHTISRKMFCHTGKIRILVRTPHIFDTAFFYHFRIIGKGSCRNLRIHRIVIDIADRRKCHITSDRRRFGISHAPHVFRVIMVSRRSNLHAITNIRSIRTCTIATGFRIAGDKQRNLAVFLQNPVLLPYLSRRRRIVATSSKMIRLYQFDQILLFL
ncbi:unknown [Roseburia sp. CAG:309]|nr:unknown [Roseburia sp. CAG:309]